MLHDIAPSHLDNSFCPDKKPSDCDIVFVFKGRDVLACGDMSAPFPTFSLLGKPENCTHLFSVGSAEYFLLNDELSSVPDGFSFTDIKNLRYSGAAYKENIFALFTAFHLSSWYENSRFCGKCGSVTVPDYTERAVRCLSCGSIIYPRINPAVIVGVTNGNKLLVTRYAKGRGVNFDALVAGFTEIGEDLEGTVRREVMEETGLKVKNIRYYKSQPWGSSCSILAGFFCEVDESPEICVDTSELSSAVWVERGDIIGQPDDMSLTNEMMMYFKYDRNVK